MVHFLKIFLTKIVQSLPLEKASNKQFKRERELTQQVIRSCVEVQA